MPNHALVRSKVKQNTQVLDILPTDSLIKAWEQATGRKITQVLGQSARIGANYASAILDAGTAAILMKDLGINGRVVFKQVSGKQYVIFKGLAGARSIFTGTRYLARNPKVVDMAIGRMGANGAVLSGARLTIFVVVPLNVLNYILSDSQTMSQLIDNTATDLIKVGAASAIAALAATATATLTTLAAGPLVAAIVVGIASAMALDVLDQKYGVTNALIKALDETYDKTVGEFGRQLNQI